MEVKNNVGKYMEEYNISLNKLAERSELSINTIRNLKDNPYRNVELKTLSILANTFGCSVTNLIEDDPDTLLYEEMKQHCENYDPLDFKQAFTPENINYLKILLLQVGVPCIFSVYSRYNTVQIYNKYELSPIQLNFNLRSLIDNNPSTLQVVNFYLSVNQDLLDEAVIKDAFIKAFELYARKLSFDKIAFNIYQDFSKLECSYLNALTDLSANFIYTEGSKSFLFTQNNYEPFRYFNCITWTKWLD